VRYAFSYFMKHLSRKGDKQSSDGEYAGCRPKYHTGKSRDALITLAVVSDIAGDGQRLGQHFPGGLYANQNEQNFRDVETPCSKRSG